MSRRIALGLVVALTIVSFGFRPVYGQVTNVTNDTITPIEGVGHDYIKMLSETVNPANGGLNLRIQLPVAKSRGFTVPFSITYDSNNVHHLNQGIYSSWGSVDWEANASLLGQGGWTFAIPSTRLSAWAENVTVLTGYGQNGPIYQTYACGHVSNYVMLDLSGVAHALGIGGRSGVASGDPNNYCDAGSASPGSDGKVEAFLPGFAGDAFHPPPISVSDDLGTVYKFSAFSRDNAIDNTSYSALADSIEDRNGNIAHLQINGSNAVTVMDGSGRTSISTSGFGPSGSTNIVTVSGETFQATWRTVSANFATQSTWVGPSGGPSGYNCNPPPTANDSQTVVSQITLPNGNSYKFYYGNDTTPHGASTNPYGLVSEIDYPSGAWVTYSWKLSDTANELADYPGVYTPNCGGGGTQCLAPVPDGCLYQYKTPVVAARRVSFGGSSPALTQSFVYSTTWSTSNQTLWTLKTTTVTTQDNVTGKSASTIYSYQPILAPLPPYGSGTGNILPQVAVEQTVNYFDWDGTQLRTITKNWLDPFDPTLDQTTIPLLGGGGITSKKTYTYVTNSNIKEPQELDEFDFGANSAARMTVTNYQSFSGANGTIAGAPCQVLICSAGSSCTATSSNKIAETDYLYDGGTSACGASGTALTSVVSGLASGTHDETLFAPSSTTPRGNVTTKIRWSNSGSSPTTTYSFDETGQLVSVTDPCGNGTCADMPSGGSHITTYSYADAYTILLDGNQNVTYTPSGNTNAYLTKITDPLGHVTSFTYDFNNGQLTKATDPNSQSTSYIYNDPFARPTLANFPDNGQTEIVYNDTAPSPTVTTCHLINGTMNATCSATSPPAGWMTSVATMDGIGHLVQTELVSDPDGATYTYSTYDGFGRPYQVYNPTRCSPPTRNCNEYTWGYATSTYDALGRITSLIQPDGSTVSTAYTGPSTTVTDEVGNQRKSQVDGLGRLNAVWEAPNVSGYNFETDYQYNALDDLICAVQKGTDTTAFTNCSSSPVTWRPRAFTYDSLSRLLSASNPESGGITYTYDSNGNLASKLAPRANQTGTAQTTTNYTYDVLNRLTQKSHVNPNGNTSYYGYDGVGISGCPGPNPPTIAGAKNLVGRRSAMCFGFNGTSWSYDPLGRTLIDSRANKGTVTKTYPVNYTYFKDGSVNTITYPSGNTVTYNVGGAGRTTSVKDSANNFVMPTFPCVGCATALQEYAPFGGLTRMYIGETTSAYNFWQAAYTSRLRLATVEAFGVSSSQPFLWRSYNYDVYTQTGDNGNLVGIADSVDSTRNVLFTYDPLNRLKQANTVTATGANCWGETYTIDAWANLYSRGPVSGMTGCSYEGLSATPSTKNQLSVLSYDAAGNVTNDGNGTKTYDNENRLSTSNGVTYYYDSDGVRMEKTSGTMYWPGPYGPLAETDLNGNINEEYIFFNGQRIARVDRPSGTVHYYFSDQIGSASIITDASGSVQEQYYYYPFGGIQSSTGSDPNHYKFTGKERDSESGLDNFGARYNASSMGRFMTPDSVSFSNRKNPQSWNLYAFTVNNPASFRDSDGHKIVCANNVEQCQKDAAAATASAEAAKRVTTNTVTTLHSFLGLFHWTTSTTTIAITGDVASFRGLSTNAAKLADLVTSDRTATVHYDNSDRPMLTMWDTANPLNGGSASNPSVGVAIIDPTRSQGAVYDPDAVDQNVPQSTTGEEFAHEVLGHIWGDWFGGAPAGTRGNLRYSIAGEDNVRELDPTRGQKKLTSHHNYAEAAPDPEGPDD